MSSSRHTANFGLNAGPDAPDHFGLNFGLASKRGQDQTEVVLRTETEASPKRDRSRSGCISRQWGGERGAPHRPSARPGKAVAASWSGLMSGTELTVRCSGAWPMSLAQPAGAGTRFSGNSADSHRTRSPLTT